MSHPSVPTRVGIDVGFGDVKVAWFEGPVLGSGVFPAVLGRAERRMGISAGLGARRQRIDTIAYKGQSYFVGGQALIESRLIAARQDAERIGSTEECVLMLAALAGGEICEALIVTGLPVLWWDKRRQLTRSWTGSHQIEWNGEPRTITVHEVRPVIQPFGSFYQRTLSNLGNTRECREVMRAGWAILDIGYNTTDLSGLLNLQPVSRWCGGIRVGVRDALAIIADDIEARYQVRRPLHEIVAAFRSQGYIDVYRDQYRLDGNADSALRSLASEIITQATRTWSQGDRFHTVLITGGGAAILGKTVAKAFPHNAEILSSPALANAIGFAKYAQRRIFRWDKKRK